LIVADSAEPRLITELQKLGCKVVGTTKGAGSISAGIAIMQDYELIVEGENIAKELNNYVYADKASHMYIDNWNHMIDSIRYNVIFQLDNPSAGRYATMKI
jgi:phage terminase large subunit